MLKLEQVVIIEEEKPTLLYSEGKYIYYINDDSILPGNILKFDKCATIVPLNNTVLDVKFITKWGRYKKITAIYKNKYKPYYYISQHAEVALI